VDDWVSKCRRLEVRGCSVGAAWQVKEDMGAECELRYKVCRGLSRLITTSGNCCGSNRYKLFD